MLPFVGVFILIESTYSTIPNEYSVKSRDIKHNIGEYHGLVLGPSLTQKGVDPGLLDMKIYNASLKGMDLEYRYEILKFAKRHNPQIEIVLFSISYVDLNHLTRVKNASALVFYEKYFDQTGIKTFLAQTRGATMIKEIIKYYRGKRDERIGIDTNGYKEYRKKDVRNLVKRADRLAPAILSRTPQFVDINRNQIKKVSQFCKEENIKLIFLTTPIHKSMSERFDDQQSEEIFGLCTEMSMTEDHVYYFNFMNQESFSSEFFQDPIHLNRKGTILLSEMINSELKNSLKPDH